MGTPAQPPQRIFVSHSHEDNEFGVRLVQDLRRARGGDETAVWYDASGGRHGASLVPGDEWWDVIVKEMTARPIFLVVLSPEAAASSWVQAEMRIAWTLKHSPSDPLARLLIPILYRPCVVRADWGTLQMVSFVAPKTYEAALDELLVALGLPVRGAHPADAPAPPPSHAAPSADPATMLVRQLLPQIEASFAAQDWPDVARKAAFLIGRAREAVPPAVYRMQGRALLEEEDTANARTAFDAALALDSTDVPTLQAAARVRLTLSKPAEAAPLLQDALALASDQRQRLDLLRDYAQALVALGDWPAVLRAVAEGQRLGPDIPAWLAYQLVALQQTGRDQEALAVARQLTARPDATADQWVARARLARAVAGDAADDEVRAGLDDAVRLAPNDPAVAQARRELFPPPLAPDQFPARLASLGFTAAKREGAAYILPPLCAVPAGEFLMGSDKRQDSQASGGELPQQRLSLPAFQLARFPVTVAEYACFVRAGHKQPGDWQTQLGKLDHAVVSVSWHDAVAYAAWLTERTSQPWRLPSEAEWEKAARGGDGRIYPWGNTFDQSRCNTSESGKRATTPVGSYPSGASPCGAQEMAGNVWEWTSSLYKPYPYSASDGREAVNSTDNRVLRGGSWGNNAGNARAAYRGLNQPDYLNDLIGFRVAFAVPIS